MSALDETSTDVSSETHEQHTEVVLQELIQLLDQETELATKTKLNVDFVPGIMSVLHGKDLLARGVQSVHEALGLIPGVEISRTNDGQPQILVRGIGKSFFSNKVKFLLNSTPFNATLGAATTLLILPIEQVERIEVIRGPGSAIYGEYASVGVINIITRKNETALFGRVTDLDRKTYGGMYSQRIPDRDLSFNLNVARVQADGGDVIAGSDILANTPLEGISNAPGPINNWQKHEAVLLDMNYKQYLLSWQRVEQGIGDYFGLANALPGNHQHVVRTITMDSFELSKKWRIGEQWSAKGTVGLLTFDLDSKPHELFPAGFPNPAPPPPGYPEGVLGGPNYEDDRIYLSSEFNYQGMANHDWLLGIDVSWIDQGETYVERNYDPQTLEPIVVPPSTSPTLVRLEGDENWLEENHDRRVVGIYAQDQFSLTDRLKLTMGLRFDDYSDVGSDVTPRIAGVYQLRDKQTLKFQYARSFRPPTFLEMYTQNNLVVQGNPDLESETVDTIEAGYVYNDGITVFRSTVFYFSVHDLIVIDGVNRRYVNQGEIRTAGLELELQHQLTRKIKVDTTLTSLDTENDQTDEEVPGVAHLTANMALLIQPWPDYAFGVQVKVVGDRKREVTDSRPDLDGYTTFDITANIFDLGLRNLNLRAGINNVFDNDIVYPAPMSSFPPSGLLKPAYQNDYPQSGREMFLQVDYRFD
ncbi:MAG: TonB-dependent receptor [Gammaproteobacteria bacterium]